MDADIYENWEKEFALKKLLVEIDNAKVMCLSPKELIDELLLGILTTLVWNEIGTDVSNWIKKNDGTIGF